MHAKVCCSVDPIETPADRQRAINSIVLMMQQADSLHQQLRQHRKSIEHGLASVREFKPLNGSGNTTGSGNVAVVNNATGQQAGQVPTAVAMQQRSSSMNTANATVGGQSGVPVVSTTTSVTTGMMINKAIYMVAQVNYYIILSYVYSMIR